MIPNHETETVSFRLSLFFFSLFFFLIHFNSVLAGGVLPDTGQTTCYNDTSEIPCPSPGEPFYGQDGNYQGPQPAYQVSADGLVVTDLNTGLMWQRADDGVGRTWAAAISYCENLALGGYSDWRLPSRQELVSIVDYGRLNPAINPAFSCNSGVYWSGSTYASNPDLAWHVSFDFGYAYYYGFKSYSSDVRCVRGGP
jgi:hypothetical protein